MQEERRSDLSREFRGAGDLRLDVPRRREKSYQVGQKFRYPDDIGKICPWLLGSMDPVIQVLRFGGTLGWRYKGTPYEKMINKNGVTTEFVRCIDPASGIVVKITRTKV